MAVGCDRDLDFWSHMGHFGFCSQRVDNLIDGQNCASEFMGSSSYQQHPPSSPQLSSDNFRPRRLPPMALNRQHTTTSRNCCTMGSLMSEVPCHQLLQRRDLGGGSKAKSELQYSGGSQHADGLLLDDTACAYDEKAHIGLERIFWVRAPRTTITIHDQST